MVGPEKIFKLEAFIWLENAIFRLVFVNTVFYKRAMVHIFSAEYT